MTFVELLIMGVALAMDAFAVSICKGLKMRPFNIKQALIVGLFFGGAQGLMPLIGWFLGKQFESYITEFDHWIAFVLLAYLGWNMIGEAKEACDIRKSYTTKEMLVLAIATSIDALAVGVSFAFLQTDIWLAIVLIAIVTFAISTFGGLMGFKLGSAVGKNANICGGAVLICIGLKILLEHTGIL